MLFNSPWSQIIKLFIRSLISITNFFEKEIFVFSSWGFLGLRKTKANKFERNLFGTEIWFFSHYFIAGDLFLIKNVNKCSVFNFLENYTLSFNQIRYENTKTFINYENDIRFDWVSDYLCNWVSILRSAVWKCSVLKFTFNCKCKLN